PLSTQPKTKREKLKTQQQKEKKKIEESLDPDINQFFSVVL
ncbi:hypothetical protein LCGC14_1939580, partial [marine sediment metagenome]